MQSPFLKLRHPSQSHVPKSSVFPVEVPLLMHILFRTFSPLSSSVATESLEVTLAVPHLTQQLLPLQILIDPNPNIPAPGQYSHLKSSGPYSPVLPEPREIYRSVFTILFSIQAIRPNTQYFLQRKFFHRTHTHI